MIRVASLTSGVSAPTPYVWSIVSIIISIISAAGAEYSSFVCISISVGVSAISIVIMSVPIVIIASVVSPVVTIVVIWVIPVAMPIVIIIPPIIAVWIIIRIVRIIMIMIVIIIWSAEAYREVIAWVIIHWLIIRIRIRRPPRHYHWHVPNLGLSSII